VISSHNDSRNARKRFSSSLDDRATTVGERKQTIASWKQYPSQKTQLSKISKYIVNKLGSLVQKQPQSLKNGVLPNFFIRRPTEKTRIIKSALLELGHEPLHLKGYANKLPSDLDQDKGKRGHFKNREWLYDIHWYTEVDFIENYSKMMDRLTQKTDPVSAFLYGKLSDQEKVLLQNYQRSQSSRKKAQRSITLALERIVRGECVFEEERFKAIDLRLETINLRDRIGKIRDKKPESPSLNYLNRYLNRLLLQDAYPVCLSRNYEYLPKTLPLVAECEWDPIRTEDGGVPYGGVKFDFQKLLVANAELRLMIFILRKNDNICDLDNYFDKAIKSCKHLAQNSKFLFIAFDKRIPGFHYVEKSKGQN